MKNKIIQWIRRQVAACGAKGIVIGLSGGIDSAVASALCVKALGHKRVLGLFLPIESHAQDLRDGRAAAKKAGIKTRLIDLSGIYREVSLLLPAAGASARANLKPRLRMLVLYYHANKLNYLVCGTGNKAEIMVGYFTKFGDGGCDILPLGGLLKRQVRQLARELGIPERIITKPPTAGLWPGQTDEGEMGVSYADLDDILDRREHKKRQAASPKTVRRVLEMVKKSEHKRQRPNIFVA